MRRIQVPSGRIFEFPTDATDDQINEFLSGLDQRTLSEERSTARAAGDIGVDFAAGVAGMVPTAIDAVQVDEVPRAVTAEGRARALMGETAGDIVGAIQSVSPAGDIEKRTIRATEMAAGGLRGAGETLQEVGAMPGRPVEQALTATGIPGAALIGRNVDKIGGFLQRAGDFIGGDIAEARATENAQRVAAGQKTLEQESQQQVTSRAANAVSGFVDDQANNLRSDYANAISAEMGKAIDGGVGTTAEFIADSPGEALSAVLGGSAAYLIPGLASARLAKIAGASEGLATAAAVQGTSAVVSAQGAEGARDLVMGMSEEQLLSVPEYMAERDRGLDHEQAQLAIANKAYDAAAGAGFALNATTGAVAQRLGLAPVEQLMARGGRIPGVGRVAGAVGSAIREAPGEALQGAGEALGQNLGGVAAGTMEGRDAFEGVGANALLEAAAGAGIGGITGFVAPQAKAAEVTSQPTDQTNPAAQAARDVAEIYSAARQAEQERPSAPPATAPVDAAPEQPAPATASPASLMGGFAAATPLDQNAKPADELEAQLQQAGAAPVIRPAAEPEGMAALEAFQRQQAAQNPPASTSAPLGETPQHDGAVTPGAQSRPRPRDLPAVVPSPKRAKVPLRELKAAGQTQLPPIRPAVPVRAPVVAPPPDVAAAVAAQPDRISFSDNDVVARAKLEQTFLGFGIEPELARTMAQNDTVPSGAIRDSVTGGFDGRADGVKSGTLQRAIDHVDQTGEDSFFVSADISNLGGLNKFHNDVADEANRDFRGLTDVLLEELRATGADVVPMRTGGDEVGYVVVNASQEAVNAATERARSRAVEYARSRGFDQIPHTKASRTDKGVTFHTGVARIQPGLTVEEIAREADLGVNASKNAASPTKETSTNERREATGEAGPLASGGQAGRAAGGDAAAAGGTAGEVGSTAQRADGQRPGAAPQPDGGSPGQVAGGTAPASAGARIDPFVESTVRALGLSPDAVAIVDAPSDLPAGVSSRGLDGKTEGIYDPKTGKVYLFRGALVSPSRAVWVTLHELAGHKGLRALLPQEQFARTMQEAGTNPTIRGIAMAMMAEARAEAEAGAAGARPATDPTLFIEEALAEYTAAWFTGDIDALMDRYGDAVMFSRQQTAEIDSRIEQERKAAEGVVKRAIAAVKRALFNTPDVGTRLRMSDAEVVGLISNAYKSLRAGQKQAAEGATMQSRVPLSSKWMTEDFAKARKQLGLSVDGENKVRSVGEALDAYVAKRNGRIEPKDRSPEAMTKIAAAMADEVMVQIGDTAQQTGSGVGWYSVNYPNAVRRLASRFPELDSDSEAAARGMVNADSARNLFTMILAVTSNGEKVRQNLKMATEMFAAFRDGASLRDAMPGTRRAEALENNIEVIDQLISRFGMDGIRQHLLSEMTVKEINAELRKRGEKPSSDYTADMTLPRSALYFGAKLGAFYANLAGSTGYLTMDLWWSRSFNRYRANMLPAPTDSGMAALRGLLGLPDSASMEQLIEAATPYWKAYKDRGYKDGSDIEKKANTFIKAAVLELNEAPTSATERKFMVETAIEAQRRLRRRGVDLTLADIQAALWYYEKRLYDGLGVRGRDDIGYEEAINEQAQGDRPDGPAARGGGSGGDVVEPGRSGAEADGARGRRAGRGLARAGRDARGQDAGAEPQPALQSRLPGAPVVRGFDGPDPRLVAVAEQYARDNGIQLRRQAEYVKVDPERAKRIADAYEAMEHAPNDPRVRAAYRSLIDQTLAQYRALEAAGYRFWFIDLESEAGQQYTSSPWNAMRDIRANQRMGVFPTAEGFGSGASDLDVADNPMLEDTGIRWPFGGPDGEAKPVLANDLFRAVHDAFGHGIEGSGFRADGEENAWQAHVRLFTGDAVAAITSETRGQNSWLNFGPFGERNRTASAEETVFADQKTGLMPEWTWLEGRAGDMQEDANEQEQADTRAAADGQPGVRRDGAPGSAGGPLQSRSFPEDAPSFRQRKQQKDAVSANGIHYSGTAGLTALDGKFAGAGSAGNERRRFGTGQYGARAEPGDTGRRLYFYVQEGDTPPRKEDVVAGNNRYAVELTNLYDYEADPRGLREDAGANMDYLEELVNDAGFDGLLLPPLAGIEGKIAILHGLKKKVPIISAPLQSRSKSAIGDEWGASHSGSSAITTASMQIMAIPGREMEQWRSRESVDRLERMAVTALSEIAADREGSEERLYHGFEDVDGREFPIGRVVKLGLTSASGDLSSSASYGIRLDEADQRGTPTAYEFPVGTPMSAYGVWSEADAREFGHRYSEAIVAGEYEVTGVREERASNWRRTPVRVVSLKPLRVFDPQAMQWTPVGDAPLQSRQTQDARAAAAALRTRKSQLARELTTNLTTAEQVKAWTQRARLLIGEVSTSRDFAEEIVEAKRMLTPERRDALQGDREALKRYDAVRDMIAIAEQGMSAVRSKQAQANRLLDKVERRTSTMSLAEREALVDELTGALDEAERAYVAAKRIADWRAANDYKVIKAHKKRSDMLDFLAAEGYQQGSFLWASNGIKDLAAKAKRYFRRLLQDKMIDMRDVQDEIERQLGRSIDDLQNVYRMENLMHGKTADRIESFRVKLVEPLKAAVKATGLSQDAVDKYLWAKHAKERNAKIRAIRPGVDDGSGMTDAEADAQLASYTPEQLASLEAVSRRVEAVRRASLQTLVEAGQLTAEAAQAIQSSYSHYVPLRGKDGEGEERVGGRGTGQGISAGSPGVQRALGRKTPPKNILAELVGDGERAIVQAGKAEVGRSLLRLVLSYPNPGLWSLEPVVLEPKFSEATGEVYLSIGTPDDAETVIVKHNGKPYRVQIKHPRLVEALKNTGVTGTEWAVKYIGWVNRWFSAVFTRFNPGFVPVNLARDLLQGASGLYAELGAKSAGVVLANWRAAFAASYRDSRGQRGDSTIADDKKAMVDWAREFAEQGGKTGYTAMEDSDTLQQKIEDSMLPIADVVRKHKGNPIPVLAQVFERSDTLQWIEDVNDGVENALRIATYAHLRKDKGWSKQRAATYAKEMTVNFNRKGMAGSFINSLYLFFNAAVQGSRRTLQLMNHPKVRVMLGGLAMGQFAFAMALGMQTFGDDDDETLWEKIPDHAKRRGFIIPLGFDDDGTARYISIPMPFGFNVFPATGGYLANYLSPNWRGRMGDSPIKHGTEAMAYMTSTAIDAVSPVPVGEEGWFQPTLVRLYTNLERNKDDLGRRIRPSEDFSEFDLPRAALYTPGTPESLVLIAKGLNRLGGGDDLTPPKLAPSFTDVSPNDLEYLLGQFTGGPGTVLLQSTRAATRELAIGDMASFDIPVVRAVSGGVRPEQREAARFYDNKDTYERNLERIQVAYAEGGIEEMRRVQAELGPAYAGIDPKIRKTTTENGEAGTAFVNASGQPQLAPLEGSVLEEYRAAERDLREISAAMRAVYNNRDLGPIERQRQLVELQRKREDATKEFNRLMSRANVARSGG
jgi:hypothetical protein